MLGAALTRCSTCADERGSMAAAPAFLWRWRIPPPGENRAPASHDQRHRDQHDAEGDGSPSSGEDAGVTYGVFYPPIGTDGSNQCRAQPDHVLMERQAGLPVRLGGNDQQGPVPQIQRIGKPSDPTKRSEAQDRLGCPTRRGCAAGYDQRSSDHRNGDEGARVHGGRVEDDRRESDRPEPNPGHDSANDLGKTKQPIGPHAHEGAECELPCSSKGRKIRNRWAHVRLEY